MKPFVRASTNLIALALSLLAATAPVSGQTTISATGNPGNASLFPIEHGFINLGNGNVHLEIPVASIPQRGDLSLGASLIYDSSIWEIVNGVGGYQWSPTNGGGWSLQYGQYYSATATMTSTSCPGTGGNPVYTYNNFQWTDPHGTLHVFALKTINLDGCTSSTLTESQSAEGYAIDGSGYYAQVTNYDTLTIWDPGGTQVLQTEVPSLGSSQSEKVDRNGNYILYGAGGAVTQDSLQHTPIVETVQATDGNGAPTVIDLAVMVAQSQIVHYTINYETISTNTNFNVSLSGNPVADEGPSIRVVKSLALPDGTSYSFDYDKLCSGAGCTSNPTYAYGLLTGVTLPHGGAIAYSYLSDANAGKTEPARWVSRYTGSKGATTFAYSTQGNYAPVSQTGGYTCGEIENVVATAVLQTTYVFSNCSGSIQPMKVIQSPVASPSSVDLLTLYQYDFSNACQNGACMGAQWIALTGSTTVLPSSGTTAGILNGTGGSGLVADTQYAYAAPGSGKIATVKQWDYYGSSNYPTALPDSPSGSATRETDTSYNYVVNHALYPTQITIKDSSGVIGSEALYGYDESSLTQSSAPNHSNQLAASKRGNLTSVQQIPHGGTGVVSTILTSSTYDDAGSVVSMQDANLNTTSFTYDGTDTFLQGVTRPQTTGINGPVAHVTSMTKDFNTGQVLSSTDENNQTTGYNYDTLGRLHTVTYTNGGAPVTLQTLTYPSANETDLSTLQSQDSFGTVLIPSSTTVDGYGRPSSSTQAGVSADVTYDPQGHLFTATNAHLTNGSSVTDGTTYFYYDELGRPQSIKNPLGNSTTYQYSLNTVTAQDALKHQRQQTYNAFGDLTSVTEPDLSGALNWVTVYTLSDLGRLMQIDQKGGTTDSSQWRTRSFVYDGLGRVHSQTTKEAGQYLYGYDNVGNITSFQNQNPTNNSIGYFYDSLGRVILKQVGGGPSYTYSYDGQDASSDPFGHGRLTGISNGSNTRALFQHDALGRLTTQSERRPGNCGFIYQASAQYDFQGNIKQLTYPDGRTLQWLYDSFNRPTEEVYTGWAGTTNSTPTGYFASATYWPTGALKDVVDGSGVELSVVYDPNQNLSTLKYANNGVPLINNSYTFDLNASNLTQIVDSASGRTQTFHYDPLDRLKSSTDTGTTSTAANTSLPRFPATSMSYDIDAWGNLNQSGNFNFTQIIDASNHVNASGYVYDNAGNLTNESLGAGIQNTYSYRADGHQISSNGVTYNYDALDQRVGKSGSLSTQYFYFGGTLLATRDGGGNWTDMLYGVHGLLGTVPGNPTAQPTYRVGDRLGSLALTTDSNGTVLGGASTVPFGEVAANSTNSNYVFTGLEQDSENQTVSTPYRQLSTVEGRWLAPDPFAGSYNLSDPQSLNRYAYVLNQPVTATDPSGLDTCYSLTGTVIGSGQSFTDGGCFNSSGGSYGFNSFGEGSGNSYTLYGGGTTISFGGPPLGAEDPGFSSREAYRYNGPGSNAADDAAAASFLDWTQGAFRVLGAVIPEAGEAFNLANIAIDAARGHYGDLAMDSAATLAAVVPFGAAALRGGAQAIRVATESGEVAASVVKSAAVLGREGEASVAAITGLEKNTQVFVVRGRKVIPDFVESSSLETGNPLSLIEAKNVRYQSLTRQLRDYRDLVGPGGRVRVALPPGARVSGPLQAEFDNLDSPLERMNLWP